MSAVIRPARIADAPGIAQVHWDSNQTTYETVGARRAAKVDEEWAVTEVRFVR